MADFWVKIEFDELDFVILPVSVLKKYTRKNEFIELVIHTWKTSSMNSSSIQGKRVRWTHFPCILFFHSEHNEHDLIKCAIANTIWSSADAAQSDQVRHHVLDMIWSWRSHQVQTQPDLIKQPAEHDLIRKWVQWTRFPCILFFTTNTTNRRSQPALDTIWSSADAAQATCWGSDKKTSSMDSFFIHGRRVRWSRFPCIKNEFVELVFHVWKTSSLNSISVFCPLELL